MGELGWVALTVLLGLLAALLFLQWRKTLEHSQQNAVKRVVSH